VPTWSIEEQKRFWEKVKISDGCWIWTGLKHPKGYGRFCVSSRSMLAHRYSFQLHNQPTNLCVCHTCDNRPCVNPDHLFEGTYADNNRDRLEKGGYAKGEEMPNAKLDDAKVIEIRRLYVPGKYGLRRISERFGISERVIGRVIRRELWSHVLDVAP
jgi:hypothetical protein